MYVIRFLANSRTVYEFSSRTRRHDTSACAFSQTKVVEEGRTKLFTHDPERIWVLRGGKSTCFSNEQRFRTNFAVFEHLTGTMFLLIITQLNIVLIPNEIVLIIEHYLIHYWCMIYRKCYVCAVAEPSIRLLYRWRGSIIRLKPVVPCFVYIHLTRKQGRNTANLNILKPVVCLKATRFHSSLEAKYTHILK